MIFNWEYEDSILTITTRHVIVKCTPYLSYYMELTEFFDPDDVYKMEIEPTHIIFWLKKSERPYTVPVVETSVEGNLNSPRRYQSDPMDLEGYTKHKDYGLLTFYYDNIEVHAELSVNFTEIPEDTRWLESTLRKKIAYFHFFEASFNNNKYKTQRVILQFDNMQRKHADIVSYTIVVKEGYEETEEEKLLADTVSKKLEEIKKKEENNGTPE